jgi:hypothetical protein
MGNKKNRFMIILACAAGKILKLFSLGLKLSIDFSKFGKFYKS